MDVFSALSEPRRRRVIEILASRGRLSATEICDEFDVTPQAMSQHLRILREADLVSVERRAQRRLYGINPGSVAEMERWAEGVTRMWNSRLAALEKALKSEEQGGSGREDGR